MKKFDFRLQRVLDYRNVRKKQQEQELAQERRKLFEAEERRNQLESLQAQAEEAMKEEGISSMAELSLAQSYQEMLMKSLDEQENVVKQAIEAVEQARDIYIERAIEAEMLETVKKKKIEDYKLDKKRDDQKTIDKIVVSRHRGSKQGREE